MAVGGGFRQTAWPACVFVLPYAVKGGSVQAGEAHTCPIGTWQSRLELPTLLESVLLLLRYLHCERLISQ